MTNEQLANYILSLSAEDIDEVIEYIYQTESAQDFHTELLTIGVDASKWCRRKHPPAG